jgi:Ca2+-binding EF-hand superfamily protein
MRNLSTPFLATALTFGVSMLAFATEPQSPVDPQMTTESQPTFEQLDTNRDGQVAKSEIPAEHELTTLFASFDDDGDENLSRAEFDEYAAEDEEEAE